MHIAADDLVEALAGSGYRITKARRAVCEVVAEAHDQHLSAADVYDRARRSSGARVDRSTVYRTLEALEDAGLLSHSHLGHGPSVYHLAEDAGHQHLVCRSCGATVTLPPEEADDLARAITRSTGFVPDLNHFALSGLCAECAAANA